MNKKRIFVNGNIEWLTEEELINKYGHFFRSDEIQDMKNFIQPQQFQHPFGDISVLPRT